MKLVDADALWINIANNSACYHDCYRAQGEKGVLELIDEAPTIEAEPVKHGTWEEVEFGQFFECSNCHNSSLCGCENYCPKCGAKMDGGHKDD